MAKPLPKLLRCLYPCFWPTTKYFVHTPLVEETESDVHEGDVTDPSTSLNGNAGGREESTWLADALLEKIQSLKNRVAADDDDSDSGKATVVSDGGSVT